MQKPFIDALQERIFLADGGIATEIYSRGFYVNRCYDQLNLAEPVTIRKIHESFAAAGAQILRTNTFGANRLRLSAHGLAEQTDAINRKGVELAREIAGESIYVAGTLGPVPEDTDLAEARESIQDAYREQAALLIECGVDLLFIESIPSLEALKIVYETVRGIDSQIPAVPSIAYSALENGLFTIAQLIQQAKSLGISVLGIDDGSPADLYDRLPELLKAAGDDIKISLLPSAGTPETVDGRTLYLASPEYLAEFTRRYVQHGVSIVGGGGGVTPDMVREMATFLRSVQPKQTISFVPTGDRSSVESQMDPIPIQERSPFGKIVGEKFAISVELDPPKGIDAAKSVAGAKFLYENGIDVINIADGPRASGRMSPIALSVLVKQEVPIDTIIHVCCRDRNLLALQMDLISSNATGLRNLLIITGDPPKMGIYPDATAVFDLDSIGLVTGAKLMNHGLDFAHRPLKGQTSFVIGVGCNPGAADLDREAERYKQKVDAGAEFVFSQPIYDPDILDRFFKRVAHVKPIPFFVGVLPLASYKNAEFFTKEVPGMQVPKDIMHRMRLAPTKEAQKAEGIEIAAEALREVKKHPMVKGAYIFPPFGRYESILDVIERSGVR